MTSAGESVAIHWAVSSELRIKSQPFARTIRSSRGSFSIGIRAYEIPLLG